MPQFQARWPAGKPRPAFCDRRRIPPPVVSQFFLSAARDLSIDTVAGAHAKGAPAGGGRGAQPVALIKSRVRWTHPVNVPDFNFLKGKTKLLPKITIPGPCALHFRGGDAAVLASAYRDIDEFWDDIVEAFTRELAALAEAGYHYVQIDETALAKFGDPDVQVALAARGDDWSKLIDNHWDHQPRPTRGAEDALHWNAFMSGQSRRSLACRR
jgi:5-methyltetrahydropteroyltriglutamate--homocysteine methyltransferase